MTTPAPRRDAVHARLADDAVMLSTRLLPRSRGYYEIFLDEAGTEEPVEEPVYGATYLPRKFKIGLVHPADNTVDVLANDLGLVAVFEDGMLQGYQLYVGGGQGMTHNKPGTYPRIATAAGFVAADQLWDAVVAVIALQRDNGDRTDRRRARLKYVVDDRGLPWVQEQLRTTYGLALQPPRDLPPFEVPELLGWHEQGDGRWWLGIPVESGRIAGTLRTAMREVVQRFGVDPVFTPQQDVLLSNVAADDRAAIDGVLLAHGVVPAESLTPLSRWALACTALPFCGLALTEAERVRQPIIADIERVLARHGVAGERISLRITGCPNGCVRPYAGDIGLVGRVPGEYAIFVGGDFAGTRLSFKLLERVKLAEIGGTLEPLVAAWSTQREGDEGFGDFCTRMGQAALLGLIPLPAMAAAVAPPCVPVPAWRNGAEPGTRTVPEEVAVALTYNRTTHAVMMATPQDLEDFAAGFSRAEGIIDEAGQIEEMDVVPGPLGIELRMWIAPGRMTALERRRRHSAGPTGCGLCGMDSLADAMRAPPVVAPGPRWTAAQVAEAVASLSTAQTLNHVTRGVHAAGFWRDGLLAVREDVGRHNALDKLTGALLRRGEDPASGILLLTSRVSVELIQKAAGAGTGMLAAVSVPTALAIRVADAAGVTLVAVARSDGFEVFTHRQRIVVAADANYPLP